MIVGLIMTRRIMVLCKKNRRRIACADCAESRYRLWGITQNKIVRIEGSWKVSWQTSQCPKANFWRDLS